MLGMRNRPLCAWLLLTLQLVTEVQPSQFSHGREAEKLCQAYKKICPRGKVCAIQTMNWPRPMKFPVCVHHHTIQVRSRVCELAPSPGSCQAQFRRWHYNIPMGACSWFTYSGCDGNGNNFRSREECESVCITGRRERGHDHSHALTDDATRRRKEKLYPRHEEIASRSRHRSHHDPGPTGQDPTGVYGPRRAAGFYARGVDNDDPYYGRNGRKDNVPTTQPNWNRRNSDTAGGDNTFTKRHHHHRGHRYHTSPMEHRRPPVELDGTDRGPEELHISGRNREEDDLKAVTRPGVGLGRTRPRTNDPRNRKRSETDSRPSSRRQRQRNGFDPHSASTSPKKAGGGVGGDKPDVTDISEANRRRLVGLPYTGPSRAEDTNRRLSGLARSVPELPTISIRRRIPSSSSSSSRQPVRMLSLLSPRPLVASRSAFGASDVSRDGLTSSSLVSSYASNAEEAVRRFPKNRRKPRRERGRKRKKGHGRRRNKTRKQNNRRGRRRNRRRGNTRRRKPTNSMYIKNTSNNVGGRASSRYNTSSSDKGSGASNSDDIEALGRNVTSILAEHRQNKPSFWLYRSNNKQNDAKAQSTDVEIGNFRNQIHRDDERKLENRGRGRRRRRRKGRGRRKMSGNDDVRRDRDDLITPLAGDEEEDENVEQPFQNVNQYYEKVHLFGVLDKKVNETDYLT